jgi:hypothetical protein
MTLRPRPNLLIPRPPSRTSMEELSKTNTTLNPFLASRIFGGETGFALPEDFVHLFERAAFGFRDLRRVVSFCCRFVGREGG